MKFNEIKDAIGQLSDAQKEEFLFEMSPSIGEALIEMGKEAIREEREDRTCRIDKVS